MKKLKHIWWYLTDGNYRFIINNEFVVTLEIGSGYNTNNMQNFTKYYKYKCVN